jgi:CheY-like chemotaxis protein
LARKILLADDSVTAQNMGRKILTDAGYEVVTVNNGSAALKKIAESKPDLIVLDVYMPGYSGLEVCQRIKENRETARIPVLLTVGKLEPFKPEEARRARADAFVVKPFEASELLSALTKLEDKVIPQAEPYKQGRFAKAIASVDTEPEGEKFGDKDAGWKARLRIPTGKPKETEPAPEYAATQGKGFRDYVEPGPKKTSQVSPAERPMPAGLPHDITPEEIAAITAAAAQLSGTPAAPPPQEPVSESTNLDAQSPASEVEAQENAPVTFASSPAFAEASGAVVNEAPPESFSEAAPSIETQTSEAVIEPAPAEAIATQPEIAPIEATSLPSSAPEAETEEPAHPVATNVEESPVAATVEASPVSIAETAESAPVTNVTDLPPSPSPEQPMTAALAETSQESHEDVVQPPAPSSDDEVMAALQTLIPSESMGIPAAPVQLPSEEAAPATFTAHAASPRWIAEEVSLAGNEGALSLEKEMEAAYAAYSGQGAHSVAMSPEATLAPTNGEAHMIAPPDNEQAVVHAMASAAAAGEGTPVVAAAYVQAPPEKSTIEPSAEVIAAVIPEPPANASTADAVQVANEMMEGDVMAASWKNIRDSIAGAAPKPALSKEEFREPEPATVDLASPAETAPARLRASDPTAIANIVDSVLAELRPKIVEEIARKLADSKKG